MSASDLSLRGFLYRRRARLSRYRDRKSVGRSVAALRRGRVEKSRASAALNGRIICSTATRARAFEITEYSKRRVYRCIYLQVAIFIGELRERIKLFFSVFNFWVGNSEVEEKNIFGCVCRSGSCESFRRRLIWFECGFVNSAAVLKFRF